MINKCPFKIGDKVKFTPSERTKGQYQDIEGMGISIGEIITIADIKDDGYLYNINGKGGWPWSEWKAVK
ncbi:hypothetical protein ACFL1Z_08330 [Thermodesulfobacteriota bacterium]